VQVSVLTKIYTPDGGASPLTQSGYVSEHITTFFTFRSNKTAVFSRLLLI